MEMIKQNLPKVIAEAREKIGLNQSELARRLSVSPQAVQAWEAGRATPRASKFRDLAKALQIPAHVLLRASGVITEANVSEYLRKYEDQGQAALEDQLLKDMSLWDESTPLEDDEVYVPLLREVELSAGSGRFAIEERPTSHLRFLKQDLRSNGVQLANAKCVAVSGNSMFPVLRDGATVGVNIGRNQLTDVVDGEMYAISHNGQLRIKQVFRLPSGLRLRSFNRDDHPDEDYSFQQLQDEQITIIGHVFWWGMFA